MRFSDIKIGELFTIEGEKMRKTGHTTYESVENPVLGEYQIQPIMEAKIKPLKGTDAPAKAVAAKFADLKVGDAFTISNQSFKKTGVKTYRSTDGRWPGEQTINPMAESQIRVIVGTVAPSPAPTPKAKKAPKAKAAPAKKVVVKKKAKKAGK